MPAATVVVPTYGRPGRIVSCVDALTRLDPPPGGFEVVVVDDGSPERVAPLLEGFADALDLRVLRQANAGPASARNRGTLAASGDLLAFTDDDCRPHPGWLRAFVEAAGPRTLLGGRTVDRAGGVPAAASQVLLDHLYHYYGPDGDGAFVASNNLAVDRAAFHDLGGFDTTFPLAGGEDREFADRWLAAGGRLRLVEHALVDHHHAMGLREFWRQHHTYGQGAHRYHARRAHRVGHGPRPEPARFYLGLLARPLRTGAPAPLRLAALLAVSQIANALGYVTAARQARRRAGGRPEVAADPPAADHPATTPADREVAPSPRAGARRRLP